MVFFLWFSSDFMAVVTIVTLGLSMSLVIVVSPLKAFMKDQVESFKKKGVHALCVAGQEDEETKLDIISGAVQLVYISPETLLKDHQWREFFRSQVVQENLVGLVVDEAYCVKKW